MKSKFRFFGIAILAMAIAFSMVGCNNGTTEQSPDPSTPGGGGGAIPEDTPETTPTGTYTGTKNNATYTLTVYPSTAKAVHALGDNFTLTLKRGDTEKTCSGKLVEVTNTTLSAQPSYEDAEVFTITISGTRITFISTVIIAFDDGTTEPGPGTFTSGGGGGGGGGTTTPPTPPTTPTNVAVTGVSLNKSSTGLLVGGTETLYETIAPSNAANHNVTWSSNNDSVARVSTNGVVSAIAAGTATITVTTVDGNHTATCTVYVSTSPVSVTGVSLNKSSSSLSVGGTETLYATITPSNATNQYVIWSSNNDSVATVSTRGVVTAVSPGIAIITVGTIEGSKTARCIFTVALPPPATPTNLIISTSIGDTGNIIIRWSSVTEATGYNVYRSLSSSGPYTKVGTTSYGGTTYIDTGLSVNTAYYYKVSAYNGSGESPLSSSILAYPIPAVPTGLTATAISSTSITVSWSAVYGATGYFLVWWASSSDGTTLVSTNSFTCTGLSPNTTYNFMVFSTTNNGDSLSHQSSTVSATTFPVSTTPVITITTQPTTTTNVTAGSISGNLLVAASVSPSAALSYQWYSNTSASNSGGSAISGATSASFTIPTTLTSGTYYYFCEVKATGAASVRSNPATVNVTTATPSGSAAVSLTFAQIADIPDITGPTVSRTGTATITLVNSGQYSDIRWYITGAGVTQTGGSSFTINPAANPAYNILGQHFLTVEVTKGGIPYNKTIVFTIVP